MRPVAAVTAKAANDIGSRTSPAFDALGERPSSSHQEGVRGGVGE
ncbi:MAG: hypothetical protein ACRDP6_16405 [Actinoallomurus sp.]